MSNNRLGKGLEALIRPQADTKRPGSYKLPIKSIAPNPHQPRQQFDEEALQELVASIKEKGVLTPVTVKADDGQFLLIAGERRLRAAKLAGLKEIPAYVIEVKDDAEMMEMALIENIQRENLNAIEEAEAYAVLNSKHGLSQNAVAQAVGKKRATITNSLRLLNLPHEIKKSIKNSKISAGHGRAILMMKTEAAMLKLWQKIIKNELSVRAAETIAQAKVKSTGKKEIFIETTDPRIKKLEDDMISALGTKVKVKYSKGRGTIAISYFSDDDFERLFEILTSVKD